MGKSNSKYCSSPEAGGLFFLTDIFAHTEEYKINHQVSRLLSRYEEVFRQFNLEIVARLPVFWFSVYPHDTVGRSRRIMQSMWKLQSRSLYFAYLLRLREVWGYLIGAVLYVVDSFLTQVGSEGPSLELMVCRKK